MIKLNNIPTTAPDHLEKDAIKEETKALVKRIGELAEVMYAEKKHALLVVLQAMDGSGKDSTIKNVFEEVTPTFITSTGFNKPTEEEFAHDFLWRVHKIAPRKGNIQVFVRSHYEDILIQRVHEWVDEKRIDNRIEAINAFEKLLVFDNNTTILKFHLHISLEEQETQLTERVTDPNKFWKHNDNDWEERKLWDKYMFCYEEAINRCNAIPWEVVPGDQRWYRDYVIAGKIVEALEAMNCKFPALKSELFKK
jgi:PPK2 family polyphosphate:nucleotide phosphotransferase